MKKFLSYFLVAVVLTVASAISVFTFSVSAEETIEVSNNVVFISDTAKAGGDGSSASSPLYPAEVPAHKIGEKESSGVKYGNYHLKTALYQAAERLRDTGGTIVICGPVLIDGNDSYGTGSGSRDFFFPTSDKGLCITSVYDGVDYSKTNGAYFEIAAPAQITLEAPTLFENIHIKTTGTGRVLCANGNKLVMGDGIECSSTASNPTGNNYLSIVGGSRYKSLNADTDVTIRSGYYNNVTGSIWGLDVTGSTYVQNGNVKVTLEGGTFRGVICGGAINASATTLNGDVEINIHPGAKLGMAIYASGQGQFESAGHEVNINVYGGAFYDSSATVNKYYIYKPDVGTNLNYPASSYNVNFANISESVITARTSGSTKAKVMNSFVSSAVRNGFDNILYPAAWATSVTPLSYPESNTVLKNGELTSDGASLAVSFLNAYDKTTTYTNTVEYSKENIAFKAICDTNEVGTVSASYYYGPNKYYTKNVNVLNCPDVNILGARIKTSGDTQGLRYVAEYTNTLAPGMTIESFGVLTVRADLFIDSEKLNFEETYGMAVQTPKDGVDWVKTIGDKVTYTCTERGIPVNRFNIDQIVRAFVTVNYNGETFHIYSDIIRRNPYDIAKEAAADGSIETAEVKSYLNKSVIQIYDEYDVSNVYTTTQNFRNRVVNYMKAQMSMKWVAGESFWINNPKDSSGVTTNLYFEKGKTYYGIPYTNWKFSQEETFSELINDGYLYPSEIPGVTACGNTTADEAVALENYSNFPGSDCSTAVITAWNTVLNGRVSLKNLTSTKYMVPGNECGVIPVGDYDYDYETYQNDTYKMVANTANKAKILAAYDKLQPGDAIVHYSMSSGAGHTRLVVSVNRTQRTVTTIECANWSIPNCKVVSGNGTAVTLTNNNTSWKQLTYNYDYLLKDGYVPITIPELATGHSDSEYTLVTNMNLANDLPRGKLSGKVMSNRQLISIDITVSDGTNVQKINHQPSSGSKYSAVHVSQIDLSQIDMSTIKLQSGKTYYFTLNARVSGLTTTTPAVKLVQSYEFVAN